MAALTRGKSGAYKARKGIPKDVQADFARLYGQRHEAKLTLPSSLNPAQAKACHAEWLSEVEARIDAIRAKQRGQGQSSLTHRQTVALAGEWYRWFVTRHEENPGSPEHWDQNFWALVAALEEHVNDNSEPWKDLEWTRAPELREGVRPLIAKEARAEEFLASRGTALTGEAYGAFVDALVDEYINAALLLERRAKGDYSADTRLDELPKFVVAPKLHQTAGLTSWALFEQWVAAKKPGLSTVGRWRSVFLELQRRFEGQTAAQIGEDEAQTWTEQLVSPNRTPRTVNDVWLSAINTVFGWAVKTRKLSSNPFKGVTIAQPRVQQTRETKEFNDAEAALILRSSAAIPNIPERSFGAAKRWVPWLCAYTGARAGEMTKLRAEDVRQHDGIWAVHITPEAGTVKTGKPRSVPLHEHLVAQGFIEFLKARGKGPLFYDPSSPLKVKRDDATNPVRPRASKARERLGDWVREIGVTDKAVRPNHAWRHTFKRRATRAGIERGMRDAICGHSPRDVADEYETPTVADMAAALEKFPRYQLDGQKCMSAPEDQPSSILEAVASKRTKKIS
jgi:integrase